MAGSLSAEPALADHPAAPPSLPRAGEGRSARAGEPPAATVGQDRPVPSTTFPHSGPELAARVRELLAAARPGWPGRAVYALASLPFGALYLALFFGLFGSVVALVYGVGVLLILLVLAVTRGFAGVERRLVRTLLGADVPDGERVRRQPGVVGKLRRLVMSAGTWRALGWLGARVLMGAATAATLFFGGLGFAYLVWGADWNALAALPLLALMVGDVVVTLVVLELLVRLAATVAPACWAPHPSSRSPRCSTAAAAWPTATGWPATCTTPSGTRSPRACCRPPPPAARSPRRRAGRCSRTSPARRSSTSRPTPGPRSPSSTGCSRCCVPRTVATTPPRSRPPRWTTWRASCPACGTAACRSPWWSTATSTTSRRGCRSSPTGWSRRGRRTCCGTRAPR
ncbi:hypothetical protein E4P43_18855 [Blastococcus sp. TF02A-35]|nr:hypothetical protein E4P43_18855 [Blastococcus sp. TF02A_35]